MKDSDLSILSVYIYAYSCVGQCHHVFFSGCSEEAILLLWCAASLWRLLYGGVSLKCWLSSCGLPA